MTATTQIDGTTYLLGTDEYGTEWVSRYTAEEMAEIFTTAQRAALQAGTTVRVTSRVGHIDWRDMVAATRTMASLKKSLA